MFFLGRPSTTTFGASVSCLNEVVMVPYLWQILANILTRVLAVVFATRAIMECDLDTFDLIVSRGSESMQVSASSN